MTTGEWIISLLVVTGFGLLTYKLNKMATDLTQITQEVSETNTVMGSAVVLLQQLKAKLDEAGTDPVKLAELSASLDQNTNALATAISENTPADPNE